MHYNSCLFQCLCLSGSRADNEHAHSRELAVLTLVLSPLFSLFCSIEFDRDCDYFAIAGVTKKIKVFEYGTVIQDAVDIHYPVNEMTCNSKIRYKECEKSGAGLNVLSGLCSSTREFTFSSVLSFSSCISWSSYHKNLLASSDYEGTVILWDGFTGQRSKVYQVSLCVRQFQMTFITLKPLSVGQQFLKCSFLTHRLLQTHLTSMYDNKYNIKKEISLET